MPNSKERRHPERQTERRELLVPRIKDLTIDEIDELQIVLWRELDYDYRIGKVDLLAYIGLRGIISYMGYCLRMRRLGGG